jgi:hypothetical protein
VAKQTVDSELTEKGLDLLERSGHDRWERFADNSLVQAPAMPKPGSAERRRVAIFVRRNELCFCLRSDRSDE